MKGISDIIAMLLMLVITIAIAGLAYGFISGVFGGVRKTISLVGESFCVDTTGTAVIRNYHTHERIAAAEQTLINVAENCTEPATTDIPAGGTVRYNFINCERGRYHTYRLIGPVNSIEITFSCA